MEQRGLVPPTAEGQAIKAFLTNAKAAERLIINLEIGATWVMRLSDHLSRADMLRFALESGFSSEVSAQLVDVAKCPSAVWVNWIMGGMTLRDASERAAHYRKLNPDVQ